MEGYERKVRRRREEGEGWRKRKDGGRGRMEGGEGWREGKDGGRGRMDGRKEGRRERVSERGMEKRRVRLKGVDQVEKHKRASTHPGAECNKRPVNSVHFLCLFFLCLFSYANAREFRDCGQARVQTFTHDRKVPRKF